MIKIEDANAAEMIIALERRLGFEKDFEGERWEQEVREDINNLRAGVRSKTPFKQILPDGIYGQGGWDRYAVKDDGEIVFLRGLCSHMDKNTASQIAEELGFRVQ